MKITVLNKQSLQDIAIQHTGSVYNAFEIAFANNIAVSDFVEPGTILKIPSVQKNEDIFNFLTVKKIQPATQLEDSTSIEERRGIGWMKIGSTFKLTKNE